jgi:hypothetical protein
VYLNYVRQRTRGCQATGYRNSFVGVERALTLLSFSLDFLMLIWTFLKMAFIKNELKYTGILVKIIQLLSINAPT